MAERSYPREFTGLLPEESDRWVSQGLISAEQRVAILKLYPEPVAEKRDRTVLIFSILGSLLVAAGVILFFAANWPKIPAAVKVAAIMLAVVGTYGAGYYLQFKRDDYPRLGQSLVLLGGLLYGAAIWLIAQIFHLDSHWPNGFLLWGAGVLPLAWAAESRPMLYLSTLLMTIWTVAEQTSFDGLNLAYPVLMLLLVLPLSRRLQDWLGEAAVLGGLFLWYAINVPSRQFVSDRPNEILLIGRVMLLYGVSVAVGGFARLGDIRAYLSVGSLCTLGGAYLLTFSTPAYMGTKAMPSPFAGSPYLIAGVVFCLAALIGGGWVYWQKGDRDRMLLLTPLGILALAALLAHLPGEVVRMIAFNLLLFAGAVSMILLGISRRMAWVVNLGLVIFLIHVITRYFDLFFSAMNKSLFFVLGGILLLGGGWLLERNRRRWMQQMGGGGGVN